MAKILEAGDKAPKFDIPNQDGNKIKLDVNEIWNFNNYSKINRFK